MTTLPGRSLFTRWGIPISLLSSHSTAALVSRCTRRRRLSFSSPGQVLGSSAADPFCASQIRVQIDGAEEINNPLFTWHADRLAAPAPELPPPTSLLLAWIHNRVQAAAGSIPRGCEEAMRKIIRRYEDHARRVPWNVRLVQGGAWRRSRRRSVVSDTSGRRPGPLDGLQSVMIG
ncbi:uncharacterized protein [Triticum aestivum]|uniref:uncharacterized protein n=1 Tax=Triticum aestivum TaxID=4565 RepID=UPI001D00EFEB|nr:uncharacterized protein LOC123139802 [Triticum aestivum]